MSYVDTFMKEKPKAGLDIMTNRTKRSRLVDEELADFFKERAQIEEAYSKQLLKLSKKPFLTDKGMFSKLDSVWESLQIEVGNIAATHGQLSQSIYRIVERPVRESTNIHSESSHLRLIESNVQRLLKEHEDKTSKIAKLQKTVEKSKAKKNDTNASKMIEMSKILEEIKAGLEYEMRRFYEQSEWVDRSRLDTIKKAISNYNLLQIDNTKQNTQMLEQSLEAIRQFDTSGQLVEFCTIYRELNLSSSSLSTANKLTGKIDSSGFGSWILRPRKNSSLNLSDSSLKDPNAASAVSLSSNEILSQSQPTGHVDEEGFSIPPPESARDYTSDGEKDSEDEASETSSFTPAQKVKFDIREEAIKEDPNDIAKALTNITTTLRGPPPAKRGGPRGRRERQLSDAERPLSTVHETPTLSRSPLSVQKVLRPASEYSSSVSAEPQEPPISFQLIEIIDAVKGSNGTLQIQVSGEVKAFISPYATTIQIQEAYMGFSQVDSKIEVSSNPQYIVSSDNGYRFQLDDIKNCLGHEIVVFKYRIYEKNISETNLLPIDLDTAFINSQETLAIQFCVSASFNEKKIAKIKKLCLGAKVPLEAKESQTTPSPKWDSSARELTWNLDKSQPTPNTFKVIGNIEGIRSLLLALEFDFTSTAPIIPITWVFGRGASQGTILPCRAEYSICSGIFLIEFSDDKKYISEELSSQSQIAGQNDNLPQNEDLNNSDQVVSNPTQSEEINA